MTNERVEIVGSCNVDELLAEIARKRHPDPTPIRPGSANAGAAFKAGEEDEYVERMKQRYEGEW